MKITVFPYLTTNPGTRPNPYIHDMVQALSGLPGVEVVNPPHRNPLLSLLPFKRQGEVVILNWFESIPDFKHGRIQTLLAAGWFLLLKLRGRKIVWVLHNKRPHSTGHARVKRWLSALAAWGADLIVTHASEGVELVRERFPSQAHKARFLHHPTKNRLSGDATDESPRQDLLVWGHITAYKGVLELLEYLREHPRPYRVLIAGGCSSPTLRRQIEAIQAPNATCSFRAPSFDELRTLIRQSRFVLIPYHASSILSSGILMDSLSFGAKVIGPDTGAFHDYAKESRLKVYTFRRFSDLADILARHGEEAANLDDYRAFLDENDWPHFARKLLALIS